MAESLCRTNRLCEVSNSQVNYDKRMKKSWVKDVEPLVSHTQLYNEGRTRHLDPYTSTHCLDATICVYVYRSSPEALPHGGSLFGCGDGAGLWPRHGYRCDMRCLVSGGVVGVVGLGDPSVWRILPLGRLPLRSEGVSLFDLLFSLQATKRPITM